MRTRGATNHASQTRGRRDRLEDEIRLFFLNCWRLRDNAAPLYLSDDMRILARGRPDQLVGTYTAAAMLEDIREDVAAHIAGLR